MRKIIAKFLNQKGFTLVEMMIVGAIMSVLMLAFSGYMYQQARQNQNQMTKQNFNQLKSSVMATTTQSDSLTTSETAEFDDLP